MALENALVGRPIRLEPPFEGSGADMLRRNPDGVRVVLAEGGDARIVPGPSAAGWLEILEDLRRRGAPVFLETEDGEPVVIRLLLPLPVTVSGLTDRGDQMDVQLHPSHARFRLRRANPDFGELVDALRDAEMRGSRLLVTATDDHEIIDVRVDTGGAGGGGSELWGAAEEPLRFEPDRWLDAFLEALRRLLRWLLCWFRCVSPRRAQELFDLAAARSCDPLAVPVPCIPFLYPDDGCWGRAHEMCRLFLQHGVRPRKVWIYGGLHVETRNNPSCFVNWYWHVAPIVCVRGRLFRTRQMVIDPALFDAPVTEATWKSVQGDPGAVLERSDAEIFWRSQGGTSTQTDPTYQQAESVLATYRLFLKNRALSFGPPPYAGCP
ncbi:MAG: protein-glutamine glutaminase family protein [Gemmatimonadota bacterium]|nr:hypothetical protein [Gemmatimonadota bacterium]